MKVKCQVVASSFLLFAALSAAGASLREAYAPHFNVGVALGRNEVADPVSRALAAREFSSATVENVMKPCVVQPREGVFRWDAADDFVSFAEKSGMKVIGHCLVWHSQTAAWMFEGPDGKPASRELMIERMRKHIHAVVGRYKGRVKGWDVVNEAVEGDGSYRKSRWLEQVGGDYIALAFKFAHEADPDAELYYNDYGMASRGKREAVVRLVRDLKAKGLRIDGVGMQSHVSLKDPNLCEYEKSLAAFAAEGVKVCVTELDVSVLPSAWGQSADISATHEGGEKFNPWKDGKLPTEMQEKLAARYRDLFEIYLRHAKDIDRVTFWGLTDKQSWLNDFPVKGRIDYPLLFDREGRAKPCYDALLALPGRPRSANACPAAGSNVVKTALFTKFAYAGRSELEPCDLKKQYRNPIVAGMGPDPAITKKDGDFYLAQSSFSYFPGIPVYHSKDLVNWDFCGYVGNRTTNLKFPSGLDLSAGVFAPDIKYNPYNDTFYLIVTVIGDRGNVVYKTKDPYLGWSEPIPVPVGGIDPSFYFEDDKTAWILNNDDAPDGKAEYSGHRTVRMRKYDLLADKCVPGTERIIINKGVHPEEKPIWCEGPHLYKIDGRYWVMTAEGGTASEHSEVMWVSENVEGPYKPCKINPILTQRDLPGDRPNPVTAAGHADLFQTRDGGWMAVFLGIEPYEMGNGERGTGNGVRHASNAGRSTFLLPVEWVGEGKDRQPVILPKGKVVPRVVDKRPWQIADEAKSGLQLSGNVEYTDDFSSPKFDYGWFALRSPYSAWARSFVEGLPGLVLDCRGESLSECGTPSFLARWVRGNSFDVEISVDFEPAAQNEFAGLCYYQNEQHHYEIGKTVVGGKTVVAIRKTDCGKTETIATEPAPKGALCVRVVARGKDVSFEYAARGGAWRPLGGVQDASILSTDHAGGFVAATVGPFATSK